MTAMDRVHVARRRFAWLAIMHAWQPAGTGHHASKRRPTTNAIAAMDRGAKSLWGLVRQKTLRGTQPEELTHQGVDLEARDVTIC